MAKESSWMYANHSFKKKWTKNQPPSLSNCSKCKPLFTWYMFVQVEWPNPKKMANESYLRFDDDDIKYMYSLNHHKSIRDIHCCGEIQIGHIWKSWITQTKHEHSNQVIVAVNKSRHSDFLYIHVTTTFCSLQITYDSKNLVLGFFRVS